MMIRLSFLLLLFLQLTQVSLAQTSGNSQKEARYLMEKAKEQMSLQDYQGANQSFREMLKLRTALPTEMCYFFANTLFMLGQYENSLRFAEKYEKLAGVGGEFYQDVRNLKDHLNEKMAVIRACNYCDSQGYVLQDCPYCEKQGLLQQTCSKCFGKKLVKCKSCEGEGVVIAKNHFGQSSYHTCTICDGRGIKECSFCEGSGKQAQDCLYCSGSGRTRTSAICKHPKEG